MYSSKNKSKILQREKGITLIALVVTIVVLLILAGVSISMLSGDDGIITQAGNAKQETDSKGVQEQVELMTSEYIMQKNTGGEESIKKYYQNQASKGEISSIKDNGDNTYTISKDGYEVKIDENGKVIDLNEKETVASTDVWYKIDGTILHLSNSDLGGYTKHDESLFRPNWTGISPTDNPSPITKVIFDNEIAPTSMKRWFQGCINLTEFENMHYLNTSNATTMEYTFLYCNSLTNLDISNFDTSNVTTMQSMFSGCSSLTNLDVSNFDTSNVTTMQSMFSGCSSLTNLDVSNFNTSNVELITGMFQDCSSLTSIDVSNFDTSNVRAMTWLFYNCSSIENIDLSNFDTRKINNMYVMFSGCTNLKSLNISSFDTSNVTQMRGTFQNCSSLTNLDVSNFNTSKVTMMDEMFDGCSSLKELDLSSFDTTLVVYFRQNLLNNVTCPVYIGENWTLTPEQTSYNGTFQTK